MTHDVIAICPVCASDLSVTRLHCAACGTTLEGEFSVGRFNRLTREQMTLLESFLRSRGNLRDIERELGISYPTVRARVDSLVRALGFGEPVGASGDDEVGEDHPDITDEGQAAARQDILERLARHEIGAEEAAAAIRASAKGKA
jgi:hypothetical protein